MKGDKLWIAAGIFALLALGGGVALAETTSSDPAPQPTQDGLDSFDTFTGGAGAVITNDPNTWPFSDADPLGRVCNAVARAEGYDVAGSNPFRLNNPGDISDGAATFGSEVHSGSHVTHFPDAQTGWQWLWDKWTNIVNGSSEVYSVEMTWDQLAQKWAGNWTAWSNNVTRYMGVERTARVGDAFNV
jgi:hypothetical protein